MSTTHGLGRLVAIDERDRQYPLKCLLPLKTARTQRYWDSTVFLDQDGFPYCVGYGWAHWVDDPPATHPELIDPIWIYKEAQKIDGVPFPHEGTTVRAGAKVLQDRKIISNYYWSTSVDDIVMAVLEIGPVTVGTEWFHNMSYPDDKGTIQVSGAMEGGHCYIINGVDTQTGFFRIKNSWGIIWGQGGQAFVSIADFAQLFAQNAECCLATEVPGPIPPPPPEKSLWQRFLAWLHSIFGKRLKRRDL